MLSHKLHVLLKMKLLIYLVVRSVRKETERFENSITNAMNIEDYYTQPASLPSDILLGGIHNAQVIIMLYKQEKM